MKGIRCIHESKLSFCFVSLDFDNWANYTGDKSWEYKNMLKFFKKYEDYDGVFQSGKIYTSLNLATNT